MLVTSASVTIRWNTNAQAAPSPAPIAAGTVVAVRKTIVFIRTPDGAIRSFTAGEREAKRLRELIGRSVSFRVVR